VFAYTGGADVVPKLPAARVEELARTPIAGALVMGGPCGNVVVISHDDPGAFGQDMPLFEEAIGFVGR
jgi:hypothetical protein